MDLSHQSDLASLIDGFSHDIRANFYLLEETVENLKQCPAVGRSPELSTDISHVQACLAQTKKYLNDLVTLAQTGSVDMEPKTVDVAPLVDEVLYELRDLIASRCIRVEVETPLPNLWCNRQRLKQVLSNLLRNAALHGGDRTEPRIRVFSDSTHRSLPLASVCVADNGRGIPAEDWASIFLPGQRLSSAYPEGTGLGLALVKKIVAYYGGRVEVDSQQRWKTVFRVWLPEAEGKAFSHPRDHRSDQSEKVAGPNRRPTSQAPWRIST